MTPARGKRCALAGAALVAFASGALLPFVAGHGEVAMSVVSVLSGIVGLFALFAWIQFDRRERGLARSPGFNFALAWFTLAAAPAYFLRHRDPGRRWRPLLGLFLAIVLGWNLLLFGGMVAGGLLHAMVQGATGVGVDFSPASVQSFVVVVEKLHPDPAFAVRIETGVRVKFLDMLPARSCDAGEKFTPTPDGNTGEKFTPTPVGSPFPGDLACPAPIST